MKSVLFGAPHMMKSELFKNIYHINVCVFEYINFVCKLSTNLVKRHFQTWALKYVFLSGYHIFYTQHYICMVYVLL